MKKKNVSSLEELINKAQENGVRLHADLRGFYGGIPPILLNIGFLKLEEAPVVRGQRLKLYRPVDAMGPQNQADA